MLQAEEILNSVGLSIDVEGERVCQMKIDGSTSASSLEKLEFTAENDVDHPFHEYANSEVKIARDECAPLEHSPNSSTTLLRRRKGKEKAFSDCNFNKKVSKSNDDSHETVGSCTSVGLFLTGKKRWVVERQLIVGSKRVKKQIGESPSSTSQVRQDSSFMNWISNMVKGMNKPDEDEAPTLALTMGDSTHEHMITDQKIIPYNRTHEQGNRKLGFQTIFESLYCTKTKEHETRMSSGDYQMGGCKELLVTEKTFTVNITPIACHGENENFADGVYQSNEKFSKPAYVNEVGSTVNPKISPCSSPGEHKSESGERNSDVRAEGEVADNIRYKSDTLGSLWVTRLSPRTSGSLLKQNSNGALDYSTYGTTPIPVAQKPVDNPVKLSSIKAKDCSNETPVNALDTEVSIGNKNTNEHNDQSSMFELNPIRPPVKQKNSEEMASVFARRLDALKHIKPTDVKDSPDHVTTTCFYCGRSGHNLHECSKILETERGSFLRNVSSFHESEDFPCSGSSKLQLPVTEERYPNMLETKESPPQVAGGNTMCDGKNLQVDIDNSLNSIRNGLVSDVPKGMFDAIKKLCLTRMDILKLMNCDSSLSNLDGFFLRLRLGKCGGGLRGTGYHVACITGEQREITSLDQKNSISVSLGDMKCSIEIQHISNQDFLEDELMAWWYSTLRSGTKIPSEDHFQMKLEMRKRLGF